MDIIKEEAKLTLWTYIQNGMHSQAVWWIPLSVVATIALFALVFSFLLPKHKSTVTFRSLSAMYYAGISVIVLTFIAILSVMKFTEYLSSGEYQLGMIIGLLIAYIFTFIVYGKLCARGAKFDVFLLGLSLSQNEKTDSMISFKGKMKKHWLLSFSVALPFLLLLVNIHKSYLVSVVFDNSGSMEQYNYFKDSRIAFSNVVANSSSEIDFVLTYFTDNKDFFETFDEIIAKKDPNALHTVTNHYDKKNEFLGDLNTLSPVTKSPIIEGVWQNFLTTQKLQAKQYDAKKLIVITDGQDELYWSMNPNKGKILQQDEMGKDGILLKKGTPVIGPTERINKDVFIQKGKSGESLADFYNNEIYVITWTDEYDDCFLVADCANSITKLDGSDTRSYYRSLMEDVLPEMFFDKLLLYILVGFACMLPIVLYLIKTSNI